MNTSYLSGGIAIPVELFPATATARGAAVVIAHGSDGVTESGPWAAMIRQYGNELAKAGFAVLLPHYFARTGTQPGIPAMQSMLTHIPAWQKTLTDAVAHAATLPGIAAGRVGMIGFSLGGHLGLRLRGKVPVLVEYFAPHLSGIGEADSPARFIQIHHGEQDRLVDVANAVVIEGLVKEEGVVPDVHRYKGAGHGFNGADPGNTEARKASLQSTLRFFADHL